ncbi:MAG: hypothetical protein GW794_14165, partial [Flavobacteriales bacterium]|nr:hypothetical protein [Flavobacteriales bacterium]
MKHTLNLLFSIVLILMLASCKQANQPINTSKEGHYIGTFSYGNFTDNIIFEVERDSSNYQVFFTSLE